MRVKSYVRPKKRERQEEANLFSVSPMGHYLVFFISQNCIVDDR